MLFRSVTITANQGGGSGAAATAIIGHSGLKPVISQLPAAVTGGYYPNAYYVDFGLTGPDTVFLTATASSTLYFDNIAGTQSAYIATSGISTNGTIWTVTTAAQQVSYIAGQTVLLQGLTPTAYNGTYTITTGSSTTSFTITNAAQPGAVTVAGLATILPSTVAKGFPTGRKITVYIKNNSASTITITMPNLNPANTNTQTSAPTISASRTAKFEFIVLGTTGYANDVYATYLTS